MGGVMRRFAFAVVAAACSTTTNVTNVYGVDGGSDAPVGTGPDAGVDSSAGADADADDAGIQADAAVDASSTCPGSAPPVLVSNDCSVKSSCTCGFAYDCADGGRPNVQTCATEQGNVCCPPTCARWKAQDYRCAAPPRKMYGCPDPGDGTKPAPLPNAGGCGYYGTIGMTAMYCCPLDTSE